MKIENDITAKIACLGCENPRIKRGLCSKHYQEFLAIRKALPEEQREAWEMRLIAKKKILPSKPGKTSTDSMFDEELQEFKDEVAKTLAKHEAQELKSKPAKSTKKKLG